MPRMPPGRWCGSGRPRPPGRRTGHAPGHDLGHGTAVHRYRRATRDRLDEHDPERLLPQHLEQQTTGIQYQSALAGRLRT